MTEIAIVDLFKLFAGEQNIDKVQLVGENIYFFVGRFDVDSGQVKTHPHSITQNQLNDIKDVFTVGLRTLPASEYLLLILWIREDIFKTDSLLESDRIDFVQKAFDLNDIKIKPETVKWEFQRLLGRGDISEGFTEVEVDISNGFTGAEQIKDYFLSTKGKRIAEKIFEEMKKLLNAHVEPSPKSSGADNAYNHRNSRSQQQAEPANAKRDARILELRQAGTSFKKVCEIVNKEFEGEFLDEKGAGEALRRYCERNNIQYPYGKRGRKSLR